MICVTGNSQSGKSALLRLAIGFLKPDEGMVYINDQPINDLKEPQLLALRRDLMGMVFQENALFTSKTVFENAAYRLTDRKQTESEIEQAVLEVLTIVGLQKDLDKKPEALSGGMKRRLEFARALIGMPPIMLFDEPTSGLDPINAGHVLDLIIRARDIHHISSLFVTKIMHEIPYLANHTAQSDDQGNSIITKTQEDKMRVLLLYDGAATYFDHASDFINSTNPHARNMLAPQIQSPNIKRRIKNKIM